MFAGGFNTTCPDVVENNDLGIDNSIDVNGDRRLAARSLQKSSEEDPVSKAVNQEQISAKVLKPKVGKHKGHSSNGSQIPRLSFILLQLIFLINSKGCFYS